MKKPFGFIKAYYEQEKILEEGLSIDPEKRIQELQTRAVAMEKVAQEKFEVVTQIVAEKMGLQEIPWLKLTLWSTFIYGIITVLVLFHRPDFINVRKLFILSLYS